MAHGCWHAGTCNFTPVYIERRSKHISLLAQVTRADCMHIGMSMCSTIYSAEQTQVHSTGRCSQPYHVLQAEILTTCWQIRTTTMTSWTMHMEYAPAATAEMPPCMHGHF